MLMMMMIAVFVRSVLVKRISAAAEEEVCPPQPKKSKVEVQRKGW